MNLNLENKTALVTGSTAGIGCAIAKLLYDEGATVIINGRTPERVRGAIELARSPNHAGAGKLLGMAADVSTASGAQSLIREFPTVDILINNFGVYEAKPQEQLSVEDFQNMFHLNVISGARLAQHYLKGMKQNNWGRVVFIASETGVNVPADMIPYGVSKAAQIALSRGLAETTVGTRVTVNSVLPGPTRSEGVTRFLNAVFEGPAEDRAAQEAQFVTSLRPTSLLQRFAEAEEVAALVGFLASPKSSATNGAALRVEGGLLRGIL